MKLIITTLFFFVLSANLSSAQTATLLTTDRAEWQKLSESTVILSTEITEAEIPILIKERFVCIRFRVAEAQINLLSLVIYYENGNKQDYAVNQNIAKNEYSKLIDLTGEQRIIKKILFKYQSVPNTDDKKVKLELWGSQLIRKQ